MRWKGREGECGRKEKYVLEYLNGKMHVKVGRERGRKRERGGRRKGEQVRKSEGYIYSQTLH